MGAALATPPPTLLACKLTQRTLHSQHRRSLLLVMQQLEQLCEAPLPRHPCVIYYSACPRERCWGGRYWTRHSHPPTPRQPRGSLVGALVATSASGALVWEGSNKGIIITSCL